MVEKVWVSLEGVKTIHTIVDQDGGRQEPGTT